MGNLISNVIEVSKKSKVRVSAIELIDPLFLDVRNFVEEVLVILDQTRSHLRKKNVDNGYQKFNDFRVSCYEYFGSLQELRKFLDGQVQLKKVSKVTVVAEQLLSKSTKRTVNSKLPSPPIDYLELDTVTDSDIDWIMRKIKDSWGSFLQVYGSVRVDIILSSNSITK